MQTSTTFERGSNWYFQIELRSRSRETTLPGVRRR
jgi:hypothetical protein